MDFWQKHTSSRAPPRDSVVLAEVDEPVGGLVGAVNAKSRTRDRVLVVRRPGPAALEIAPAGAGGPGLGGAVAVSLEGVARRNRAQTPPKIDDAVVGRAGGGDRRGAREPATEADRCSAEGGLARVEVELVVVH